MIRKPIIVLLLLGSVVIILLVVRIALVNNISTKGITLVNIQNQIAALKDSNELLEVQYLSSASYTNIATKAKKLGYVPVISQIDLTAPLPLALR